METVIVTTWNRPEFLTAALRRLRLADDGHVHYRICVDRGIEDSARQFTAEIVEQFLQELGGRARAAWREQHPYAGNSYNVLTAYAEALTEDPDLVHLVEDDVFVAADYLDFHRRAHEVCPQAFAVSACRNQQYAPGDDPPADEAAVYLHPSYQSIGVSFRPDRLRQVVAHASHGYLADPIGYCSRAFPDSRVYPPHAEQDGLIHRLVEADGTGMAYPAVPRAYHAGFYGHHRNGDRLFAIGGPDHKADRLLAMTAADLNAAAHTYQDHTTTPLDRTRAPVSRLIRWPTDGRMTP